jgi:hypothetical protein
VIDGGSVKLALRWALQGGARATETASPDSGQALSRENIQQLGLAALALLGRDGAPTQYVVKTPYVSISHLNVRKDLLAHPLAYPQLYN